MKAEKFIGKLIVVLDEACDFFQWKATPFLFGFMTGMAITTVIFVASFIIYEYLD